MNGTILYVGNFELPDKNAAAHRVINNGKIFRELGYRVVFLGTARDEDIDGVRAAPYGENMFEEAYPVGFRAWLKHVFDVSNVKTLAGRFDDLKLVIAYNTPYRTFIALKRAFRRTSVKVAYDCTEWNDHAEGALPKRLYKKLDESRIRNKLGKKCRDMIVISKMMEEKYRGCNLLRLPPLVDTSDAIWHQTPIEHPGTFEFCFSGTTSNKESLDLAVGAFMKLGSPDVRLRIIGLSQDEYEKTYPEQAKLVREDGRIVFMGYVSHEESVRYILSSDCYVFIREKTRRNEAGFPTKFAEAYTCGVPIITTDVSDVGGYKNVIITDCLPDHILKCMNTLETQRISRFDTCQDFDFKNYTEVTKKWMEKIYCEKR